MVKPGHPFERGQFHGGLGFPGRPAVNQFRFIQTVDGLGQRVIVSTSGVADRGVDAGFTEALGIANGHALSATVVFIIMVLVLLVRPAGLFGKTR